ncbi:MAG: YegP family protein [Ruminiclostridium sp.]|nr:YegP family protein [Ruminiclostridium sp.]
MGKFVISRTTTGFTFGLKAANGEMIATGGEVYSSLDSVKAGVKSVETNAPEAAVEDHTIEGYQTQKNPKFEIYSDKAGEFRFRLKARNGQIIAVSDGYTSKANCKNGIESVKKNSVNATVIEPAPEE